MAKRRGFNWGNLPTSVQALIRSVHNLEAISRMRQRVNLFFGLLLILALLFAVGLFIVCRINRDATLVSISTDRQAYQVGDIVQISIQNQGDRSIDIYCPEFCALGNFPTRVERYMDGQWEYFAGFCPSIEPLFGSGVHKGDYVRHRLLARDSYELEISNFEALHLATTDRLRIVYFVGVAKRPVYSNEFTVTP